MWLVPLGSDKLAVITVAPGGGWLPRPFPAGLIEGLGGACAIGDTPLSAGAASSDCMGLSSLPGGGVSPATPWVTVAWLGESKAVLSELEKKKREKNQYVSKYLFHKVDISSHYCIRKDYEVWRKEYLWVGLPFTAFF